ncbi:MAG TPA: protein-methionine-sulfoxide reductase heme-binding subunit MsrQ [Bacteroidota bacterium]|nr:protein-methionine-sulfoxide reductase heme-binding subunit MsrQ [Bacteroidota bacterium]
MKKPITSVAKPFVFLACLTPLLLLGWNGYSGQLSANPISDITNETGLWTLRLIVATLAITPLRKITRWHWLLKFRRMIGLFAFFYGCLHFTTYIWLDQFFDWQSILHDIPKRPFITVGFASFVLMIPLAVTSTQKMIRRLGGKKWDLLHRLIYLTGIGAVTHYLWLVKVITYRQLGYATAVGLLLVFRIVWKYRPLFGKILRLSEKPAAPSL